MRIRHGKLSSPGSRSTTADRLYWDSQRSSFDAGFGVSPRSNISVPSNHLENIELQQFSPQDMIAPQSVMHSMSVNMREDSPIFLGDSDVSDPKGDIISRGIISEEDARCIYERSRDTVRE